jgi:hypothetical protein
MHFARVTEAPEISRARKSLVVVWWSGKRTSGPKCLYLPLQIGHSALEQGAVTRILAALELLNHALKGKAEILFVTEPGRGFPCQARLFGCCSGGSFVLLCLNRLTFPAPGHEEDYNVRHEQQIKGYAI